MAYCKRMGFDFVRFEFDLKDRTQHWGRILGIREHLPDYELLVYLDTDSLITNRNFDIMSVVDANPRALLITGPAPNEGHIGTNGMIFRSHPWCLDFLDRWYSMDEFVDAPYYGTLSRGTHDDGGFDAPPEKWKFYEQSAFHFLYDTSEDVRRNTVLVSRGVMHAVPQTHSDRDFLVHFPGMSMERKIKAIKHYISASSL